MSDIESENEQEAPVLHPVVEIDVSQLTPLSPQVISKQVCYKGLLWSNIRFYVTDNGR
jgi:hypothetical protein